MRIYVSHSIRGKFGKKATPEQMQANCNKAILFGKTLKNHFPEADFYVPAEKDEFISLAYQKGYLTDTQILDIDCVILDKCAGLLVYSPDEHISLGMGTEIDYAIDHGIPTYFLIGESKPDWKKIKIYFDTWGHNG